MERAVLAACLESDDAIQEAETILEPDDFHAPHHRKLFAEILALHSKGVTVDVLTLKQHLDDAGDLAVVGGAAFLGTLVDAPAGRAGVTEHARVVLEKARKRRIMAQAEALLRAACNGSGPAEIRELSEALQRDAAALDAPADGASDFLPLVAADYDPEERVPVAVGTGAEILAAAGDLIMVGADSGTGKTMLSQTLGIARSLGHPLLGFDVGRRARVVVIAADGDGPRPTMRRLVRILRGFEAGPEELDGAFLRVFAVPGFCLDRQEDYRKLDSFLREFDPDDLHLDSLGALAGPERNRWDDGAMGDFIRTRVRPLQVRTDGSWRTTFLTHHLRKLSASGDKAANSIRVRLAGSYVLLAAVDACLGLEPAGGDSFIARCVKRSRWGSGFRDFIARIEGGPDEPLRLSTAGPLQPTTTEVQRAEETILGVIAGMPAGWVRLLAVKKTLPDLSPRTVERAAKALAAAGKLETHATTRGTYRLPSGNAQATLPGTE